MIRSSKEEIHKLKKTLNREFKMKDFSEVKMIIGMSILKSQKKKSIVIFSILLLKKGGGAIKNTIC